jgi:putative nucleotidyltransferase with HDIG domain
MNVEIKQDAKFKDHSILVIDCDSQCRSEVSSHLLELGFQVLMSESVEQAKELLKNDSVDLVICELRMPNNTGVELVQWIRRIYDTSFLKDRPLPVLIMTGFAHLLQQENLEDLHINECLIKPLDLEEVRNATVVALGLGQYVEPKADLTEEEKLEHEMLTLNEKPYCRVLLSDFTSLPELEMDLYIQLSKDKYVCIAHKGDSLDTVQFERYLDKGVKYLFIKREDFKKVVKFNLKLTKAVAQSPQLDLPKKKQFMLKTGEIIMENAFINGVNQETFEEAKDYICNTVNTLLKEEESFQLLEMLNDHSDYLYAHSLGVSLYSVMIAQAMGWRNGGNLFKLSYGALMHDIGKKDFDVELLLKARSELSFAEKSLLETHPERGKDILEELRNIPSEVVAIAYEHHENTLGQGYPRYLKKNRISPMARIVAVADEFCKFAIKNPSYPGATAQQAMHLVDQYKHKFLDLDVLTALRKVVKPQIEKTKAS